MRSYLAPAIILTMATLIASAACEDDVGSLTGDASAQLDAGDVGTGSGGDDASLSCDGAVCGPACVRLANCCSELPVAVFGPACATAGEGNETACQMLVDQARGIDRCRDPGPDGG